MWSTALATLTARWRRLLLTGVAILLGITFVTGALVITDTSSKAFDDQFAEATSGVDLVIRRQAAFGAAMGVDVVRDPIDAGLLEQVRGTEGVDAAAGSVTGSALLLVSGEAVVPQGPSMGLSWQPAPFNPFPLRAGREPAAEGEVVVDAATAAAEGLEPGDRVAVQAEDGQEPFTVVGIAGFGAAEGIPNATVALFAEPVAQRLFDLEGRLNEIQVTAEGPVEAVRSSLAELVGEGYELATAQDVAAASADSAKEQLAYIQTMLLVLAATALLVGAFLIANTFAIVVAQRTRELALLRAVGASGRQVTVSVLAEALVVGLIASAAGTASGVGAAVGLRRLLAAAGMELPAGPLVVAPRTVAVGIGLGLVITLLSAVGPARRAARIPPVAALREAAVAAPPSRRRVVAGLLVTAAGAGGLGWGVAAAALPGVGLGIGLVLAGAALLAPAAIAPLAGVIGRPLTRLGVVGTMARGNAMAAPRRTAATATALAIGLAVVSFMTVVATSVKASIGSEYADVITADAIVESARGEMLGGLSPEVRHHIGELPEVAVASALRYGHWLDAGAPDALTAADPATLRAVADVEVVAGDLGAITQGGIALAERNATEHGVGVGGEVTMTLPRTGEQRLPVVAIFDDAGASALATGYLVSLDTYARHFGEDVDAAVLVQLAPGVDAAAGLAAIRDAVAEFPTVAVQDQVQARASRTGMIDSILSLVTVLLLLAVAIALLGIANTLGLSIMERTREVGLLRAVGAARRQVAWMVRLEAVLVAVVGAVVGLGLGLLFGWATVAALSAGTSISLVIPGAQLAAFLLVAAIGGALAGMLPARRASRLDVLVAVGAG